MTVITADRRFQLDKNLGVVTLTGNADGAMVSVTLNSKRIVCANLPPIRDQKQADALADGLVDMAGAFSGVDAQALSIAG